MARKPERMLVTAALGAALLLAARVSAEPRVPVQEAEVAPPGRVVIGAKNFTESHLLAEMMALVIEAHTDLTVVRRTGLGGTLVCFEALTEGEIDLYPDYTGTGWSVVLKEEGAVPGPLQAFLHVRERFLELYDVEWLSPFGLNNTYALAMDAGRAEELGVHTISDLRAGQDPSCAFGFSVEYLNREDGWARLAPNTTTSSFASACAGSSTRSPTTRSWPASSTCVDAYTTDAQARALRPARPGR